MIGLSQHSSWRSRGGTTLLFKTTPVIPEAKICAAGLLQRKKEQEKHREEPKKVPGWLLVEKGLEYRAEDRGL